MPSGHKYSASSFTLITIVDSSLDVRFETCFCFFGKEEMEFQTDGSLFKAQSWSVVEDKNPGQNPKSLPWAQPLQAGCPCLELPQPQNTLEGLEVESRQ